MVRLTLDSTKILEEGGSIDTKFYARLEKLFLKMEQFFVALKTLFHFCLLKQMLDAVTALDVKSVDFKVSQSSLSLFIFCLRSAS